MTTAQQFITQYPTPRALRQAFATEVWSAVIPENIQRLLWDNVTIADVMASADFQPRDISMIWNIINGEARREQQTVWHAPDGTITRF